MSVQPLTMANAIRALSMDAVHRAKSGHQGMPLGMADVATVLWTRFLKFDAAEPHWPDRDRFVLSAGHGSMLLYALLHLTGFEAVTMEEIKHFRQWGSLTPGHPEYGHTPGVETTTGPLGQGLATAVGMAMAERSLAARYGDELVDHRTWVIAGDGCLMEGVSHEAAHLAGRLKLAKLTVLFDDNDTTIDGRATLAETGDQMLRFKAAGWATQADRRPRLRPDRPSAALGRAPGPAELHRLQDPDQQGRRTAGRRRARPRLRPVRQGDRRRARGDGLALAAVRDPGGCRQGLAEGRPARPRRARALGRPAEGTTSTAPPSSGRSHGDLPAGAFAALDEHIAKGAAEQPAAATRVHSGAALEALIPAIPEMIGGSADLTGSNNTIVKGMTAFDAPDYARRYVHYGVREHGMAAAMNGMAVHGGLIPYSGTFLAFADYSRAAIRLGALMGVRVIHVMTHDSIGLGEDGPTHQPVEHLAALRAMPNLLVFRPADAVETAECWKAALSERKSPSLMALSRQKTAAVRTARRRPFACRAPTSCAGRGRGRQGHHLRLGNRGRHRAWPPASSAEGRGHRRAGGLDPLLGAVRAPGRRLPRPGDRPGAGARRRRGGGAPGLGAVHRRGRRLRRHERLRRLGPVRAALPGVRHHPGGGGRRGESEAGVKFPLPLRGGEFWT